MGDQIEDAIQIGLENQELIALGKSWCSHIRTDRAHLGVGMVEQATGLPIGGGRFTCDYARNPVGLAGMRLAVSALGFYENNCIGCADREPGERVPNLGTWADERLAERSRHEEEERAALDAATAATQARASHRTLRLTDPSADHRGPLDEGDFRTLRGQLFGQAAVAV